MAEAPPAERRPRVQRRTSSVTALIALASHSAHEFLSEKAFTIAWTTIVSAHVVLGLSRLVTAAVHVATADPDAYASVTMIQIPQGVLMAVGWSMAVVAIVHLAAAIAIIGFSVYAKKLTFQHRPRSSYLTSSAATGPSGSLVVDQPERARSSLRQLVQPLTTLATVLAAQVEKVFGVDGLVGVNGPFFLLFFDVLKLVEVITQTFQAYQLSRFVDSRALNAFIVVMIFINGALPPVTEYVARHQKRTTQRLLIVIVDLTLDLVHAEAIPALVLLPTMAKYDWRTRAFPPEVSFDTVWANNAVAQTRFVLVTSYVDLVTTLVPHINFLLGLHLLKSLLHHRADVREVVLPELLHKKPVRAKTMVKPRRRQRVMAQWWSQLFRLALFAWGAVVLGVHILAQERHAALAGCKSTLAPWRLSPSDTTPCAVIDVNCHRLGIRGDANEIEHELLKLDADVVTTVAFVHCPALTVPPLLQNFSRLIAVEFFNNTLVDWGVDASLTRARHKSFHHVFFFETNMTTIPAALVHNDLPRAFQYVAIHSSNISHVPDAIGSAWSPEVDGRRHRWRVLSFIQTKLRDLPASFHRLTIDSLQLIDNPMERLPSAVAQRMTTYAKLRISGRDFRELPTEIERTGAEPTRLERLYVEQSSVETVPSWLTTWLDSPSVTGQPSLVKASFHGSLLCQRPEYATKYVRFCQPDLEFDVDAIPLDFIKSQWAL